jgi:hydroxymethyl cephem carbamoyltransferase
MLVLAMNPGHDGAAVAVKDRALLFSLEAEKDSYPRYTTLNAATVLNAVEHLGEMPDVVAFTGGLKIGAARGQINLGNVREGVGYLGAHRVEHRPMNFLGRQVTHFSSSHERGHIMGAIGMAPRDDSPLRAVLVWEGLIGCLYLVDHRWVITRAVPVLSGPGSRYANLFALADPTFPDQGFSRADDSGKLMALAAYGDGREADQAVTDTVDRILMSPDYWPFPKYEFRDSPIYNAGVQAGVAKTAFALLSDRIFSLFAVAARESLPRNIPLHIAGGCGLNCDWNTAWRESGHFSSVFVPPCPNDSGLAIGTAIDSLLTLTGEPYIDWNVYGGLEFEWDRVPDPAVWQRRDLDEKALADALARGRICAWVQGRAEIGPRALGNRSLLAEPFNRATHQRLNKIKQREGYRPIAPCCRVEDLGKVFDRDFDDPYMLYFRMFTSIKFEAVTHVDGSARCQTVTKESNKRLHDLLTAFADRYGIGMLCNTSLNYKGMGFINKMSDLQQYCRTQGVDDMVVGDAWFERKQSPG